MKVKEITRHVRLRQWADDINDRLARGVKVRDWCEEKQISLKTYYYRLRRVRESAIADASERQILIAGDGILPKGGLPAGFAELPVERHNGHAAPAIVLRYRGGILEINNEAEQGTIEKTLLALASTC